MRTTAESGARFSTTISTAASARPSPRIHLGIAGGAVIPPSSYQGGRPMLVLKAGVPKLRIDELAFSPDGGSIIAPAGAAGVCRWAKLGSGPKAEVLTLPAT